MKSNPTVAGPHMNLWRAGIATTGCVTDGPAFSLALFCGTIFLFNGGRDAKRIHSGLI